MDALDIIERSPGPAIATDQQNRVLGWNGAARELLGHAPECTAEGRPLRSVLDARDIFGNRWGTEPVAFLEMIQRGEGVRPFEFQVTKADGGVLRLAVSVVVVLGQRPTDYSVVYLMRPVLRRRRADEAIERLLDDPEALSRVLRPGDAPELTRRQTEVIRLLADGQGVEEIADSLNVSVHTVRSHVQNILAKLGVHSQVEAVARAFRERLL